MTEGMGPEGAIQELARDLHREVCGCAATPDWCDSSWLVAAERAYDAIRNQERQQIREALEDLQTFGLCADAEHPGFSEIGEVVDGSFLRREQVLASLENSDA